MPASHGNNTLHFLKQWNEKLHSNVLALITPFTELKLLFVRLIASLKLKVDGWREGLALAGTSREPQLIPSTHMVAAHHIL